MDVGIGMDVGFDVAEGVDGHGSQRRWLSVRHVSGLTGMYWND
jgi:hypothetical protein